MMTKADGAPRYRIAMVAACPFPANHGTPAAIRELSITLARQGHDVHLVTYPHGERLPVDGVTIHRVSSRFVRPRGIRIGPSFDRLLFDFLLVFELLKVVRTQQIDVIHTHNYEATIAGAIVKLLTGVPLIYNGINSMADELPTYDFLRPAGLARGFGRLLDQIVPRTGDVSVVLSEDLKEYLVSLGMNAERIVVIPPGVVTSDFESGDGQRVRERHGLEQHTPLVVYTGALESFQGLDYLLHSMQRVCERKPDAVLMIVNNIPNQKQRQKLDSLITELKLSERVIFVEHVPFHVLPDYLAAADVTVVPRASCLGFPIKLLNYMAAGKATVSFRASAKSLTHGHDGYVATDRDTADLAKGIELYLDDPSERRRVGERALASAHHTYNWERLAEVMALVYQQVALKNSGHVIDLRGVVSKLLAGRAPVSEAGKWAPVKPRTPMGLPPLVPAELLASGPSTNDATSIAASSAE